ncbi:F390 synthetase-related protein [uncultured Paracoccus sp.]|uniref:F390 synthetase-related protein n=1 Tax=uncultured Paracoccus sp. TaxID=189685 RepID=UPI00260964D3|nr:F390 synthetase-related protein [uncultured Paracoccus sp.]
MTRMSAPPERGIWAAIRAFARHRWGGFADRAAIETHQRREWARMRRDLLPLTGFYRGLDPADPHDLPAMDRDRLMAEFDGLTTSGLTRAEAEAMARSAEPGAPALPSRRDGLAAGFSTGTSGRRGLYVTGPAERRLWAGALAGRFWPRPALRPQRTALFLRADNRLYDALNAGPLRLRFFGAMLPAEVHVAGIAEFDPTVLAGPPSTLLALAEALAALGLRLRPSVVLCGAEPAEPQDLSRLEQAFGIRPDIIYQCTEGVLAMTCRHGRLHLNEGHIAFRREVIDAGTGAFLPIISDLSRRSLMVLNYRLDDVLLPDPEPCPCGCASTGIARIEGRLDDAIFLPAPDGMRWISSEALRRIAFGIPGVRDWALAQTAPDRLRFHLTGADPAAALPQLRAACAELAHRKGCVIPRIEVSTQMPAADGVKRRRILRLFA